MSSARSAYRPNQNMSSRMRGTVPVDDRTLVIGSTSASPWSGWSGSAFSTQTSLLPTERAPSSMLARPPTSGR